MQATVPMQGSARSLLAVQSVNATYNVQGHNKTAVAKYAQALAVALGANGNFSVGSARHMTCQLHSMGECSRIDAHRCHQL